MPCPDKTPSDKNILFANEDNKYRIISMVLLNLPNRAFAASTRDYAKKVPVGGNGAAAGARISRLTLVIRLEPKLINKTKLYCCRLFMLC